MGLIGHVLDVFNKTVVVEDPCYRGVHYAFRNQRALIQQIPVFRGYLETDQLPQTGVRLLVVTPSHQFPLGYTMTLDIRSEVLRWAEFTGSYILENDYDSDFRYDSGPLPALHYLDRSECVIYLGTFSKSIGPNLRLGYVVFPDHLAAAARATKAIMDGGYPWLEQRVMSEFMTSGAYSNHIIRIRRQYLERRNALISQISKTFGPSEFDGMDGGMHMVWHLPDSLPSASELQRRARGAGVGVYCLQESPALQAQRFDHDDRLLLLGYTSLGVSSITEAIKRLSNVVCERY